MPGLAALPVLLDPAHSASIAAATAVTNSVSSIFISPISALPGYTIRAREAHETYRL
jgi:hypothetical protein